jgi:hypothetical protein
MKGYCHVIQDQYTTNQSMRFAGNSMPAMHHESVETLVAIDHCIASAGAGRSVRFHTRTCICPTGGPSPGDTTCTSPDQHGEAPSPSSRSTYFLATSIQPMFLTHSPTPRLRARSRLLPYTISMSPRTLSKPSASCLVGFCQQQLVIAPAAPGCAPPFLPCALSHDCSTPSSYQPARTCPVKLSTSKRARRRSGRAWECDTPMNR